MEPPHLAVLSFLDKIRIRTYRLDGSLLLILTVGGNTLMLTRPTACDSMEERMRKFDERVKVLGYRSPTKTDLVPNAELLMIDVEPFMDRHSDMSIGMA